MYTITYRCVVIFKNSNHNNILGDIVIPSSIMLSVGVYPMATQSSSSIMLSGGVLLPIATPSSSDYELSFPVAAGEY
jgi:hypothetical protein